MNKHVITYIILSSTVFILIITYIEFSKRLDAFAQELSSYENDKQKNFEQKKLNKLASLENSELIYESFLNKYNRDIAVSEKDTVFAWFIFWKRMNYTDFSPMYIDCLHMKVEIKSQNVLTRQELAERKNTFEHNYGLAFSYWYNQKKEDYLMIKEGMLHCESYFPDAYELKFNDVAWRDFESFLQEYSNNISESEASHRNAQAKLRSEKAAVNRQLNHESVKLLNAKLNDHEEEIVYTKEQRHSYHSSSLGGINYSLEYSNFDSSLFNQLFEEVLADQWRNNRLRHGSMPYANCFGAINSCDGWNCSEINVKAGDLDVIVLIKNAQGNTVRHGYIRSGRSLSFYMPNGRYQVFFKSGSGWNPNKEFDNAECPNLRGSFVENVAYTKDNYERLHNHILSYELVSQVGGNFQERLSSENEFFD